MTWTEADHRLYPSNSTRTTCDPARTSDWKGVTPTGRPSITTCAPAGCDATQTDPKNVPRSTDELFTCNGTAAIGTFSPTKMISSTAGFAEGKASSVSEVTGSMCRDLCARPVMFAILGCGSGVGVASSGAGISIASASPRRAAAGVPERLLHSAVGERHGRAYGHVRSEMSARQYHGLQRHSK